ncbi:MAG: BEN domain-containing protein [Sedimenticola sp.]
MKELKGSLKAVKRRVKELEEHSGTRSPDLSLSAASEETNSFDGLMRTVSHLSGTSDKEINAVIRDLTMKLFSKEDLRNCTRTGKKTNKTGDAPKPALDKMKLTLLERVVRTKSPSVTNELFKKKLDNILKMERRASMKQQDLV